MLIITSLNISGAYPDYENIIGRLVYEDHGCAWSPGAYKVLNLMVGQLKDCGFCLGAYFYFMLEHKIQGMRIWRLYHYVSNETLIYFIGMLQDAMLGYVAPKLLQEAGDMERHDIKPNFEIQPSIHLPDCKK